MNFKNIFSKIPLVLSIVFFCTSLTFFIFFYRVIDGNNKKSSEKEEAWLAESLRREGVKEIYTSFKSISEDRDKIDKHFAKSSDIVPFLDSIEGLTSKINLKAEISSVDVLPDKSGLMIGMRASGTFSDVYKFLTLLENFSYELDIVGVDMSKTGGTDVEGKKPTAPKWDANFRIKLVSFI